MSDASASGVQEPDILRSSQDDRLLRLFMRDHPTRVRFPSAGEVRASYERVNRLYLECGEPVSLRRNLGAVSPLAEKAHQLSPRRRELVKAAFDKAALLLTSKVHVNEVMLTLRISDILGGTRSLVPRVSDPTHDFLRQLQSVLQDVLYYTKATASASEDPLENFFELDSDAQLAFNQLDQHAQAAMMQLMTYLASRHASHDPHVPSPSNLLTATQALELATVGGEYLEIIELSGRNPIFFEPFTFERFARFPLFFRDAIKEVFQTWATHGFPEPFSIGAVMIAAARQALYKRLSSATMAYPPGQVAPAVKQFFDTRRASFDYFLGMRTTLDPAELSYLLAECDHLDKVKWFIAKKRGEGTGGNFVDPREINEFLISLGSRPPQMHPAAPSFSLSHIFFPISRRLASDLDKNATMRQVKRAARDF